LARRSAGLAKGIAMFCQLKKFSCFILIVLSVYSLNVSFALGMTKSTIVNILPQFTKLAEKARIQSSVPGMAIAIVYGDDVLFLKGFGVQKAGGHTPVTKDTVFQIASLSKPITSTVIASLVGEKKLRWDSKVSTIDSSFALSSPFITANVTLADLLSHRSGLPSHAGDLLEDLGFSQEQILYRLRFIKALGQFRESYAYTNFGLTQAAVAAATSQGVSWQKLLEQKLLYPLAMTKTSSRYIDYKKARNKAINHVIIDGKAKPLYRRNPDAQSPAGGISSTARDMAKWLVLQINQGRFESRQVIDSAALSQTHQPQMIFDNDKQGVTKGFYGFGWNVAIDETGVKSISHSGAFLLGVRSYVKIIPTKKLGIVILSNAAITGLPEAVSKVFFTLLEKGDIDQDYVAIANEKFKKALTFEPQMSEKPKVVLPSLALSAYTGTYKNEYFGPLTLVEENKRLVVLIGPKKMRFLLTHWSRDVFYLDTQGENATGKSPVIFTIDAKGGARQLTIDAFNEFGLGVFSKAKKA
jgi:CubicO group peptidase (beta-lactamase class C family)